MAANTLRSRRKVVFGILAAISIAAGIYSLFGPDPLFSSPDRPRAWAAENYRILTSGTASAGHPLDPGYCLKIKSVTARNPRSTEVEFSPAAKTYIPRREVIDFDGPSGFSVGGRAGRLRWMAGASINDKTADEESFVLFRVDGSATTSDGKSTVAGTFERVPRESGWFEKGIPHLEGFLAIDGFSNPRCFFREVFDSATHVPLSERPIVWPTGNGLQFGANLTLIHEAPVFAVFDIYHGAFRDFACKPANGASIVDKEFKFEVVGVFDGVMDTDAMNWSTTSGVKKLRYDSDSYSAFSTTTSILYQINPPAMREAIILEALDAGGNAIEGMAMHPWDLSLIHFNCRLSRITSLRVRYLPERTRLLMRIRSLPGVLPAPRKPTNLFDLKVPEMTFYYPEQMQKFIGNAVQFKMPGNDNSRTDSSVFPLVLPNASPRDVMDRYLELDSNRRVVVDSRHQTIEFEQPSRPTWISNFKEWLRRKALMP